MSNNKLWSKNYDADKSVESFTVGNDRNLDLQLARYDVDGSKAHIAMLNSIGMLTGDELSLLTNGLNEIAETIAKGEFTIEEGVEDVHSQVELMLTRKLGDIGKKIHAGRSRNDQVLVDLKLLLRDRLQEIARSVKSLFDMLQSLSERFKDYLMPGYTHLQVATPSSFGLWFGAYAEALVDDMQLIAAAYRIADQNPLGSAAGYGSSFPLDRQMTTELLGFSTMHYNVINAQMGRGRSEHAFAVGVASVANTLAHLSMDMCMWMCQNFAFVSFPDEFTTGSSIMPHKKNPDVFEIIRGRCNRLRSVPNEIDLLTGNLPLGYNRDMQLLKDIVFPTSQELEECIAMCMTMLSHISIRHDILDDSRYDYIFTVEDVNRLAREGMPFREAYRKVGMEVQNKTYKPNREVCHTHQGSIGNLCTREIADKMNNVLRTILPNG